MLKVSEIRDNKELYITRLQKRNKDFTKEVNSIINVDEQRRSIQVELDENLSKSKQLAKQIGDYYKQGKVTEANALKEETLTLKELNKQQQSLLQEKEIELQNLLYEVPNIPNEIVPKGKSDQDNEVISTHGKIPELLPKHKLPHWEIADKYNIIDFDLGAKITGAGFPVYLNKGAKLQRGLINFFLDEASNADYKEVIPPLVINKESGIGTGQLPDKEGQMYHITEDNLYLIPTAEVPITNIYRDVILDASSLPKKNVGYTPCFRREAGSYGKDVRGLNRLHQFDKVEIVQVVHPSKSYEVLDEMVKHVENLLTKLELPYRLTRLCGGDLGFTSALTYDLEVYSAAQEKWLEVSSISNFETYQSNRLKLRYREDGKLHLAHTLNGSALALPRILAALLENNQTEEGIKIPKALQPYVGFSILK